MRTDKSMLDVAFDIINESTAQGFSALMSEVAARLEMTEEEKLARLGEFYTDLSLDGRFVTLADNTWDLRTRHTFKKVHIDVGDVYSEDESEAIDEDDEEEEDVFEDQEDEEEEESKGKKVDLEGTGIREGDF